MQRQSRYPDARYRRRVLSDKRQGGNGIDKIRAGDRIEENASWTGAIREAAETVWGLTKFAAFLHCLHEYVIEISMCCGPSMLPTLNAAGDIVLMDRISPRFGLVKVGDVVICKSPTDPTQTVCKRVAALEGDIIPGAHRATVPQGHVWLLGDNPDNSTDSRYYGAVPAALIKGRVFCRIYPFSGFKAM